MKKLTIFAALLAVAACGPSIETARVNLSDSDKEAATITDEWVKTDTNMAIAAIMDKLDASKPLQKYLAARKTPPKMFVGEVQNGTAEPYLPIDDMNEKLLTALFDQGTFQIIDNAAREKILKEISYQNDGMVDPAQAKKIGKQSGADIAVFGAVRMQPKTLAGRTVKEYSVNIRITELETSNVIFMGSYDLQKYSKRSGGW
ncbi:MAG: penicillin-binding protein activator LpoB [Rickettsiales bacterium]|jgi:hypothetical protein|nr:penicillin-binding protein activator LpoB [Rickettsiales bacterium]